MLIASDVRTYICRDPVDMRKAIDGLSYRLCRDKGCKAKNFEWQGFLKTPKNRTEWQLFA